MTLQPDLWPRHLLCERSSPFLAQAEMAAEEAAEAKAAEDAEAAAATEAKEAEEEAKRIAKEEAVELAKKDAVKSEQAKLDELYGSDSDED